MTTAQFTANAKKLAHGYGIALGLATVGGWKAGCKGSAVIVSRRKITVSFTATSTAALGATAAVAANTLTGAELTTAMQAATVPVGISVASDIGSVSINGATSTGIAAMATVAVMVVGLFWQ